MRTRVRTSDENKAFVQGAYARLEGKPRSPLEITPDCTSFTDWQDGWDTADRISDEQLVLTIAKQRVSALVKQRLQAATNKAVAAQTIKKTISPEGEPNK